MSYLRIFGVVCLLKIMAIEVPLTNFNEFCVDEGLALHIRQRQTKVFSINLSESHDEEPYPGISFASTLL